MHVFDIDAKQVAVGIPIMMRLFPKIGIELQEAGVPVYYWNGWYYLDGFRTLSVLIDGKTLYGQFYVWNVDGVNKAIRINIHWHMESLRTLFG